MGCGRSIAKRQDTIMLCCEIDNTTIYSESQGKKGKEFPPPATLENTGVQGFCLDFRGSEKIVK